MKHGDIDRNQATYVGMDCHPSEHTAIAVNRFEEEKGRLTFANRWEGIQECLSWLQRIDAAPRNVIIGLEGRGGKGSGFLSCFGRDKGPRSVALFPAAPQPC